MMLNAESVSPDTVALADNNSYLVEEVRDQRFLYNIKKHSKWRGSVTLHIIILT